MCPGDPDGGPVEDDLAYAAMLRQLLPARRFGIDLGLARMQRLCAALGDPEAQLGRVVHVAGTNGKGSTAAMIAAVARAHGARVAMYTSPHLASLRERVLINGACLAGRAWVDAHAAVVAAGGASLTFFEQVTAIGWVLMAAARPDVTVLEVGLGGRLDATNVVDSDVAVVTGVALDHETILGATLDAIAHEKAGIARPGRPCVVGRAGEAAGRSSLIAAVQARGGTVIDVTEAEVDAVGATPLGLAGPHQRVNAATALAAVAALRDRGGLAGDDAGDRAALATTVHPGRFERIADAPAIWLDGAHNPHGMRALAAALAAQPRPRIALLAISADKDVAGMLAELAPAVDGVVASAYAQARALAPEALAQQARAVGLVAEAEADPARALARAAELAGVSGTVVVAGSLYWVGQLRPWFRPGPIDPFVVSDPAPSDARPG